jgi:hypothetical protein
MFLWFIAVVRDQVGAREDQFFATGFLGSGLIFVAMLFAAAALAVAPYHRSAQWRVSALGRADRICPRAGAADRRVVLGLGDPGVARLGRGPEHLHPST